jgi:4-hydroxybenzoyl-CoA reductase subunit beta
MRLPKFEYQRPKSVKEASTMLKEAPEEAMPVAGGTDLLVAMKQRVTTPRHLVALKGIPGLDTIEYGDGTLRIGALTTLRQLSDSPLVQERTPVLAQAARKAGSPQIRNMATIGGNICSSRRCWYYNQSLAWRQSRSPCLRTGGAQCYVAKGSAQCYALHCADTVPALLALDAEVKLVSEDGERITALDDFYLELGPKATTIEPGQLLTAVHVPVPPRSSCGLYLKYSGRPSINFPLIGVGAVLERGNGNGTCEEARLAVGAICPRPVRLLHGEEVLRGEKLTPAVLAKFVEVAAGEIKPIPYIYGTPGYKRRIVRSMLRDTIEQVWHGAKSAWL